METLFEIPPLKNLAEDDLGTSHPIPGRAPLLPGFIVGRVVGFTGTSEPLVDFPRNNSGSPLAARTTVELPTEPVSYEVVLIFEQGQPAKPVIVGCIQPVGRTARSQPIAVELDGQ